MKQHFSNETVKHSANCHSVSCLLDTSKNHVPVFYFQTENDCYNAESLDEAARLWVAGGSKKLVSAGRVG